MLEETLQPTNKVPATFAKQKTLNKCFRFMLSPCQNTSMSLQSNAPHSKHQSSAANVQNMVTLEQNGCNGHTFTSEVLLLNYGKNGCKHSTRNMFLTASTKYELDLLKVNCLQNHHQLHLTLQFAARTVGCFARRLFFPLKILRKC